MLVVALVSGGKDSCHALGLALQNGHEVACLANLAPPVEVMELARREAGGEKREQEGGDEKEKTEDVDSHCFQTVGAVSVDALAAATGLPLVRRHLLSASTRKRKGEEAASPSVARSLNYDDAVAGDEVEDLAALLAACRRLFPGIEGVVSGAVASDYQRLRVEHAAARAGGLISVAPLWRKPQQELLEEMRRANLDAILVKVACVGLSQKHVGMRLRDAAPELLLLARQFGVHPTGEGGEYETMTLDCYAFTRAKLAVVSSPASSAPSFSVVDAGAGTFVAKGLRLEAVLKEGSGEKKTPEGEIVWADGEAPPPRLPSPLSPPAPAPALAPAASSSSGDSPFVLFACGNVRARVVCVRSSAGGVQVSAIAEARKEKKVGLTTAAATGSKEEEESAANDFSNEAIAEAVAAALDVTGDALRRLARRRGGGGGGGAGGGGGGGEEGEAEDGEEAKEESDPSPFSRVTHVRLYLPTIGAFGAANTRYGERMPRSSPPARACVACELGSGGGGDWGGGDDDSSLFAPAAVVDVLALPPLTTVSSFSSSCSRLALHVQSISSWTPACIGPYAQAVSVGGRLLRLSGQIGLDPWGMELVSSSRGGDAAAADEGNAAAPAASAPARLEARRALESCQAVAVACKADLRRGGLASCSVFVSAEAGKRGLEEAGKALDEFLTAGGGGDGEDEEEQEENRFEDEYLRRLPPAAHLRTSNPLRTFFVVSGLPRGAAVEFEPLAWASTRGGGNEGGAVSSWSQISPSGRCDALISAGRLCMARAVSNRGQEAGEVGGGGDRGGGGGPLERAFGGALEGIAAALRQASPSGPGGGGERLAAVPVSARAFYRSSGAETTIASASAALRRAWEERKEGLGGGEAPLAVPVAALGAGPEAEGEVVVEVHFESSSFSSGSGSDSD